MHDHIKACPKDGQEQYKPSDEEIDDAIKSAEDMFNNPDFYPDWDYCEMGMDIYKKEMKVLKYFKDEYYKCMEDFKACLRMNDLLKERIKWLEIDVERLEEEAKEILKEEE